MHTARTATVEDRPRAIDTFVRAFERDPVLRWFFPDDDRYETRAAAFFGYLFDLRLEGGLVIVVDDGAAVSAWTPPGGVRQGPERAEALWEAATAAYTREELERIERFETSSAPLHPAGPYWYLGVVGVAPERQGAGLGRAVIEPGLAEADRSRVTAFLETGTESNLPIYTRLGFSVVGDVTPGGGPRLWGLRRAPVS